MPLHDVGYRRWSGEQSGYGMRWFAITNKGFEIALRGQIVRRMMFLAWLPAFYFGIGFFLFESYVERSAVVQTYSDLQQLDGTELEKAIDERLASLPGRYQEEADAIKQQGKVTIEKLKDLERRAAERVFERTNIGEFLQFLGDGQNTVQEAILSGDDRVRRRTVWSFLLMKFLRGPQGLALILLIGWVSSPLISKDLRTKAFLLYFSRPLTRSNYILGKLMILIILSMVITTLPAFILYFVGIGMSQNLDALEQTWDLPFRVVAVSLIHILPASMLALMFSSLTTDSRFAHFSWYASWILGFATWKLIDGFSRAASFNPEAPPEQLMRALPLSEGGAWRFVSLFDTIQLAQGWAMGVTDQPQAAMLAFFLLVVFSLFCLLVTWYRVSKAVLL